MSRLGYLPLGDRLAVSAEPLVRTLARFPPLRILLNLLGRLDPRSRGLVVTLPYLWLLIFFAIPFLIVLKISFADQLIAQPPYSALYEITKDGYLSFKLNLNNYGYLFNDALYWKAYLNSMKIAFFSALIALFIGYPMAYGMARSDRTWRKVLLMLVILPFWTSFLLRVYAWIGLLNNSGIINNILMGLGVIDHPIVMMKTDFAVYVGIVYSYLPFMVPPRRSGITNSPSAGMNTNMKPARIPGRDNGRVIVKNALNGLQPRSAAASSKVRSIFSNVVYSGSTMKGK